MWDDIPEGAEVISPSYDDIPEGAEIVAAEARAPAPSFDDRYPDGVSDNLVSFVKKEEGYNPKAYFDHKQYSIGWGSRASGPGEVIDEDEAERRLRKELNSHYQNVTKAASEVGAKFSPQQLDALTSFDYNTGKGAYLVESSNGDVNDIASRLPQYRLASGQVLPGLVKRRQRELSMFSTGDLQEIDDTPAEEQAAFSDIPKGAKVVAGQQYSDIPESAGIMPRNGATSPATGSQPSSAPSTLTEPEDRQELDDSKPLPIGGGKSIMDEVAKAGGATIRGAKRGLMEAGMGLSETVNRYTYAPIVHGLREAIEYAAPKSGAAKFAKFIDGKFAAHLDESQQKREKLSAESTKEGFAGEVGHGIGQLGGDLPTILMTGNLLPTLKAGIALVNTLRTGAASMTLPAMRAGTDSAEAARKEGKGEAGQFMAWMQGTGEMMAMGAIPMSVESKAASALGRVASRTAKAAPVASATVEAGRQLHNLLPGEDQPFDPWENLKATIPLTLLGGFAGKKTTAEKIMFAEANGFKADMLDQVAWMKGRMEAAGIKQATPEMVLQWGKEWRSQHQPAMAMGIVSNPKAVKGFQGIANFLSGKGQPTPTGGPPQKPTIRPVYKDPLRPYQDAPEILIKSGFKELGQKVSDFVDTERKYSGQFDNPFRLWSKGMGKQGVAIAEKQFAEYWESVDKNGLEASKKLYEAASPATREAIDIWKASAEEMSRLATKNKLQVKEGDKWRPIRDIGEKFFPRRIKPEWLEVLRNPYKHPKEYEALRREMIAKGFAKDAENADKYAERVIQTYDKSSDEVSGIERARTAPLPSHLYDYGFETARNYISSFSKAMARIEAFGQSLGGRKETALDRAEKMSGDEYSKHYIKKLRDAIYETPDPWAWPMQLGRSISTVSFLGNFRSSLRNLVSGTKFNLQHFGIREGVKALLDVKGAIKAIDTAYEKGILHDDLANMMTSDTTDFGRGLNKFTNKVLKWNAYRAVEEYTRGIAVVGARAKLRTAIRDAQKDPTSRRALNNAAYFKRLRLDPQKLIDENGQGPLTDRYLRSAVAEIQGGYHIDQTPLFINTEAGKTLFHLQKWGTQALRHFDRNVVNPALQAIGTGRKETVSVRDSAGNMVEKKAPGSVLPLARYLLLAPAFGLAQQEAEEWIFGIPDREASFAEILMRMDKDTTEAMGMLAHKLYSASLSVGAMGMLGNLAKTVEVVGPGSAMAPPPLQILNNAGKFILQWYDQGQITATDVREALNSQLSITRTTGQMAAQVNIFRDQSPYLQMVAKKQDMQWLRATTKRFEDDMGINRMSGMRGSFADTPLTPFYSALEEKLLLGDSAGAEALIEGYVADMTPSEEKLAMQGIKKSVAGNRPISAGGSKGEAVRAAFMEWADENLPKEDVVRIKEIDDTYRETASMIGLFNPKPVKNLDAAMEEFMTRNRLKAGELEER